MQKWLADFIFLHKEINNGLFPTLYSDEVCESLIDTDMNGSFSEQF